MPNAITAKTFTGKCTNKQILDVNCQNFFLFSFHLFKQVHKNLKKKKSLPEFLLLLFTYLLCREKKKKFFGGENSSMKQRKNASRWNTPKVITTHTHTHWQALHNSIPWLFSQTSREDLKTCEHFVLIQKHLATFSSDALRDMIASNICWAAILQMPELSSSHEKQHRFCYGFTGSVCSALFEKKKQKKQNLHVTADIKHLFLQLSRQKQKFLICIFYWQQCMHCRREWTAAVLIFWFPGGMIWEFPAVSSCQKAHTMIRGTTAWDSLWYSEHIATISTLLPRTKNSPQDRWVPRDFSSRMATALMH